METNEADFSPQQSFELIEKMINKAKDRFNENGHLYLLWGWTVLTCSVVQFILIHYAKYEKHYYVWFFAWSVIIYQFIYMYKRKRKIKVRTYADELMGYVWITFCILIFLIAFFIGRIFGGNYYQFIFPLILTLYGMPAFLCGAILRFRPLMIGGIGCWILALTAGLVYYDFQLLFVSGAVIIAWIIPGYLLRSKYRESLKTDME
jgi:hypothetical protein